MQMFGNQLEDFIKVHIINGNTKKSPLVVHLNMTGYDEESLSVITSVKKGRIVKYIKNGDFVDAKDCMRFDNAFELPLGTFEREYKLWFESLSK
jgi:hypothetical protein